MNGSQRFSFVLELPMEVGTVVKETVVDRWLLREKMVVGNLLVSSVGVLGAETETALECTQEYQNLGLGLEM